jgi:glycosyltransferase involved in cell wall biosynthesis
VKAELYCRPTTRSHRGGVRHGSTDDPASVAARFAAVRFIRQENRGISAARNAGLATVRASYVVFLDADDRLLPRALEASLSNAARHPDAAMVYGGFRMVDADLRPIFRDEVRAIEGDPYLAFLRGNVIGVHSAVTYRRDVLLQEGGFDERLRSSEGYDIYLKLARRFPIVGHDEIVVDTASTAAT